MAKERFNGRIEYLVHKTSTLHILYQALMVQVYNLCDPKHRDEKMHIGLAPYSDNTKRRERIEPIAEEARQVLIALTSRKNEVGQPADLRGSLYG